MSIVSRGRGGAWLCLATCCVLSIPAQAAPRAVVAGPAASGYVFAQQPKPRSNAILAFVVQPVGPSSLRVLSEICERVCTLDDRIVPGTMEGQPGGGEVVVRATHPTLGAVTLTGKLSAVKPGTVAMCRIAWKGTLAQIEATGIDYHRVSWSGRVGSKVVKALPYDPCSFHHLAGTLVVT